MNTIILHLRNYGKVAMLWCAYYAVFTPDERAKIAYNARINKLSNWQVLALLVNHYLPTQNDDNHPLTAIHFPLTKRLLRGIRKLV